MPLDESEKERRRKLLHHHYRVENDHDLPRIMETFAGRTEMIYNRQAFVDADTIAAAHAYMGFSTGGALEGLTTLIDREHFTDDEIVVEGHVSGRHVGEFQGFAATGRQIEMAFIAFYRFDADGKLVSERVVMNLGTLGHEPTFGA